MDDRTDEEKSAVYVWGPWFANGLPPCDWPRAFEAYGHAMATAASVEELMILLLTHAEVFRLGARATAKTTHSEIRQKTVIWQRERFNGLMNQCFKTFDLSKDLRDAMKIAKDGRDHLAHLFWRAHGGNLWTEDGIDIIAAECAHHAHHFRLVAEQLIAATGVNPTDYIEMKKASGLASENNEGWHQLLFEGPSQ